MRKGKTYRFRIPFTLIKLTDWLLGSSWFSLLDPYSMSNRRRPTGAVFVQIDSGDEEMMDGGGGEADNNGEPITYLDTNNGGGRVVPTPTVRRSISGG